MKGAVGGPASRITSEARGTWRVLAEYPDLADDWMRLQAQSDGTPFTHWHWISTWLEQLPAQIAALETEQATIQATLADGSLYATDNARAVQLQLRDGEIEAA